MSENGRHQNGSDAEQRLAHLEYVIAAQEPGMDYSDFFVHQLDDEDPRVRALAMEGLWGYADPHLIDRLIEMAEQDPSPLVRGKAISTLGAFIYLGEMADYEFDWGPMTEMMREDELSREDFERVKAYLLDIYQDERHTLDERRFALEALSFHSDPKIAEMIEEAYHHSERAMKISAVFAMGRNGRTIWDEIIERELYSEDQEIQLEAIRAAGQLGLVNLGVDLLRLTHSDDRDIMLEAIEALGQTGWEGAFERLEELTLDPDAEIAEVAENALDDWLWISEMQRQGDELDEWDDGTEDQDDW
jgi:HEAT repeat protein